MTLGEKLKQFRLKRNMKQSDLAIKANISRVAIGNYERGERQPSINIVVKLAKALDIPVTDLISPEGIELRKENAGLEGLKAILECIYDEVIFNWNESVDHDNIPEHDGEFDVLLKKDKEEIFLTKQSYETLFKFVCNNIPVFIGMIADQEANELDK